MFGIARGSRVHRGGRVVLAGLFALGVVSLGGLNPPSAHATDRPGWSVVEASQDFCVNPSLPCSDRAHLANLGYEEVAAVNFSGKPNGTPDAAVLVCAKAYMAANGHIHNLAGHAFPGPRAASGGYDGGSIIGTMSLATAAARPGTESDTHALGFVSIAVSDPIIGTTGTARGTQITDNATDTPLGGKIDVTISGNLEDQDLTTGTTMRVKGTISCSIHLPYAIGPNPIGQPPDSESVISDTDAD